MISWRIDHIVLRRDDDFVLRLRIERSFSHLKGLHVRHVLDWDNLSTEVVLAWLNLTLIFLLRLLRYVIQNLAQVLIQVDVIRKIGWNYLLLFLPSLLFWRLLNLWLLSFAISNLRGRLWLCYWSTGSCVESLNIKIIWLNYLRGFFLSLCLLLCGLLLSVRGRLFWLKLFGLLLFSLNFQL